MERPKTLDRIEEQMHALSVEEISGADVAALRELLPAWLALHLQDGELRARTLELLTEQVAGVSDAELLELQAAYRDCGAEYRYYPASPVGRPIGRTFISQIPTRAAVEGTATLREALARGPTLLVSNHLSYADSQFADFLTASHGDDDLARRIAFVAGPKVYEDPFRRMATVCLNTLPTVQSSRLSYNDAGLSLREIAKIARRTIQMAFDLMNEGVAVLLYAEGSRSRTGRLGSFLKATCRYAQLEGLQILPMAHTGSRQSMPLHHEQLQPAELVIRYGDPIIVADPRDAAARMAEAWQAVADLLAPSHKPGVGTEPLV